MNELDQLREPVAKPETFDQIRIGIVAGQDRSWSFGEIKKPETSTIAPSSRA